MGNCHQSLITTFNSCSTFDLLQNSGYTVWAPTGPNQVLLLLQHYLTCENRSFEKEKKIPPSTFWLFLTFSVCGCNERKITLKLAIAAVRSIKLNSSAFRGCKHIPLEAIWLSSYFYLLPLKSFFITDASSETERNDMFVQGCMLENEPMLRLNKSRITILTPQARKKHVPGTASKAGHNKRDDKSSWKRQTKTNNFVPGSVFWMSCLGHSKIDDDRWWMNTNCEICT